MSPEPWPFVITSIFIFIIMINTGSSHFSAPREGDRARRLVETQGLIPELKVLAALPHWASDKLLHHSGLPGSPASLPFS